jgi:uncharacterized protein YbaP (TraB family)
VSRGPRGHALARLLVALLLCLPAFAGRAADAPATARASAPAAEEWHSFWSVQGRHNTVWLLGSVHLLQPKGSAPTPQVLRAYAASTGLVMELDLGKVGPDALLGRNLALLTLPEGQSLRGVLGIDAYERFVRAARPIGLDPDFMSRFQPWFAAMTFEQLLYVKQGFDPMTGVDQQFAQLATADGKPVTGLETIDEQLGFFASMTPAEQRDLLLQTLDDATGDGALLASTVEAWRRGDTRALEALLREGREKSPVLYRRLTTERNQRWMAKLLPLLEARDNYLVIVGALHLVGDDGLVSLLERQGYRPVQH